MKGALTTELPRQPHWSESNISYKRNIDYQTFAPRALGPGITSVGRRDACSSDQMLQTIQMYVTRHISNQMFIIREVFFSAFVLYLEGISEAYQSWPLWWSTFGSKYAVLRTYQKWFLFFPFTMQSRTLRKSVKKNLFLLFWEKCWYQLLCWDSRLITYFEKNTWLPPFFFPLALAKM